MEDASRLHLLLQLLLHPLRLVLVPLLACPLGHLVLLLLLGGGKTPSSHLTLPKPPPLTILIVLSPISVLAVPGVAQRQSSLGHHPSDRLIDHRLLLEDLHHLDVLGGRLTDYLFHLVKDLLPDLHLPDPSPHVPQHPHGPLMAPPWLCLGWQLRAAA